MEAHVGYIQVIRHSDVEVVYLDIETGGLNKSDDVLQIAMVSKDTFFNRYIRPSRDINPKATEVNGFTNYRGNLYLHGKRVNASPLRSVLIEMLEFLRSRGKLCVLVAHQCQFDASRLLLRMKRFSLVDEFRKVILGFTDTLSLFKERFPQRGGPGAFKLTTLAEDFLNLSYNEVHARAHNAIDDVEMLEQLVSKFFSHDYIVGCAQTYDYYVNCMESRQY